MVKKIHACWLEKFTPVCVVTVVKHCFLSHSELSEYTILIMSRASVIVSREPPDPDMDPRVKEILLEADVEDPASNHIENYEFGDNFSYFEKDLNVVVDEDDNDKIDEEEDNEDNDNEESDNDDDDDNETINVNKKPYMTKQRIRQENKDIKETKIEVLRAAKESMKNREFPSIRACALHYNIAPSTLSKKLKTGDDYIGQGRKNEVTIIVVQSTGSYTGKPYLFASLAALKTFILISLMSFYPI